MISKDKDSSVPQKNPKNLVSISHKPNNLVSNPNEDLKDKYELIDNEIGYIPKCFMDNHRVNINVL